MKAKVDYEAGFSLCPELGLGGYASREVSSGSSISNYSDFAAPYYGGTDAPHCKIRWRRRGHVDMKLLLSLCVICSLSFMGYFFFYYDKERSPHVTVFVDVDVYKGSYFLGDSMPIDQDEPEAKRSGTTVRDDEATQRGPSVVATSTSLKEANDDDFLMHSVFVAQGDSMFDNSSHNSTGATSSRLPPIFGAVSVPTQIPPSPSIQPTPMPTSNPRVLKAQKKWDPLVAEYHKKAHECSVSLCVVVRDEEHYFMEWLEYHMAGGVCKFFVYENGSAHPLLSMLKPYIDEGTVVYQYVSRNVAQHIQVYYYQQCISRAAEFPSLEWMGFFDADEFIVTTNMQPIPELLSRYDAFGGLALNWRQYGISGHLTRPTGKVVDNYWQCFAESDPNNLHIKTFANLRGILSAGHAHFPIYKDDRYAVTTEFERVDGPFSPTPLFNTSWVAHFVTRSYEDLVEKIGRGSASGLDKNMTFFHEVEDYSTHNCSGLIKGFRSSAATILPTSTPEIGNSTNSTTSTS